MLNKKKKVSKRNKRAWRKHTYVDDIEEFLEEKRADQRLGLDKISSKKDEDLFLIDTEAAKPKKAQGKPRSKAEKKLWAIQPATYELALIPRSAIDDPIKRNKVRSKEERKHPAKKAKDLALKESGILRKKEEQARANRRQSLKVKKKQFKQKVIDFKSDVWGEEAESLVDDSWLGEDAKREALKAVNEFKVKPPVNLRKPRSLLPQIEAPHPGLSYNPSFADHKELIDQVVEKELGMMKEDARIARAVAPFKSRVTQSDIIDEMLQGLDLPKKENDEALEWEESEDEDDKSKVFIKKGQPKMKTRKQKRAKERIRKEARERRYAAVERKKISDMHRIKKIVTGIDETAVKNEEFKVVRDAAKLDHIKFGTKRLARVKFEEPLEDFTFSSELTGCMRKLKAKQSLLRDRFASLQKRNILQPTTKMLKIRKRKVKTYFKKDHKLVEEVTKKIKKGNKIKVFDNVN